MIKCAVNLDLLPLYVEGECSSETRRVVEEHIATCDSCANSLRAMTEPVAGEDVRFGKDAVGTDGRSEQCDPNRFDETAKDMTFKKGFKKIRRHWLISILCMLLIIPLAGLGYLGYNEKRGEGYAFSNLNGMRNVDSFMKCFQEGDYAGAVEYYDIASMYPEMLHADDTRYFNEIESISTSKQTYRGLGLDRYVEMVKEKYFADMTDLSSSGLKVKSYSLGKPYRRSELLDLSVYPTDNENKIKEYWCVDVAVEFSNENGENDETRMMELNQVFTFKMDGDYLTTNSAAGMIVNRESKDDPEGSAFIYNFRISPNPNVLEGYPSHYSFYQDGMEYNVWILD